MTKIILHGGYAGHPDPQNNPFFSEMLKGFSGSINVLLVFFAKPVEEYGRLYNEVTSNFQKNAKDKELHFEIASENDFLEHVANADIIYLQGGRTLKLIDVLKQYPEFEKVASGKVIAGESAGAYALSACFYSKTEGGLFEGLAFVPAKVICHYEGMNEEKLEECSSELETLLLKDYEYKVFEK